MKHRDRPSALVFWWLIGAALGGGAQAPVEPPDAGSISGRVVVLGESSPVPIRRARVTLEGGVGRQVTDTDTDGRYRFAGLRAGSYQVTAEKPG